MKLLSLFALVAVFVADSDAAVTITTPAASGTAACSGMGSVEEGTTSGVIETAAGSTDAASLAFTLETNTDLTFDIAANNEISIAVGANLNFEAGATVNVIVLGDDSGGTTVTATCVLTLTNKAPTFSGVQPSQLIVPASTASADPITTLSCSDGGGTISSFAKSSGDDTAAKFSLNTGTGALTKSATAFDTAVKTSYTLVFTCDDGVSTATTTLTICLDSTANCPNSNTASFKTGLLSALVSITVYLVYQLL